MTGRTSTRWTAAAVAVATGFAITQAQAQQMPRVNWKMQSAFGSNAAAPRTAGTALREGRRAK